MAAWLLRAIWRPEQVQQTEQAYSITSSAVASSAGGTVRPLRVPRVFFEASRRAHNDPHR
jgi:hypothetical protein